FRNTIAFDPQTIKFVNWFNIEYADAKASLSEEEYLNLIQEEYEQWSMDSSEIKLSPGDNILQVSPGNLIWASYIDTLDNWGITDTIEAQSAYGGWAGPVKGTWTSSGNPYVIVGDIEIQYNDTLLVENGVEILFLPDVSLTINSGAYFTVQGLEEDSVRIRGRSLSSDSSWGRIYGYSGEVDLNFATIDNAYWGLQSNGMLRMNNCRVSKCGIGSGNAVIANGPVDILNCRILDNMAQGIWFNGATGSMIGGEVIGNDDIGIYLRYCSGLSLGGIVVSKNSGYGIYSYSSQVRIDSVQITNNLNFGLRISAYSSSDTRVPIINYSQLYGNATYDICNYTGQQIDARYNWWGHATAEEIDAGGNPKNLSRIYDYFDYNSYGMVNYSSWAGPPLVIEVLAGPYEGEYLLVDSTAFAWTASGSDTPAEMILYSFKMDLMPYSDWGHDTSITYSSIAEGYHQFTIRALDTAANIATEEVNFAVDLTPPATELVDGPGDGGWSNSSTVTFGWLGTDNVTPRELLQYSSKMDTDTFTSYGYMKSITYDELSEGEHSFEVRTRDLAGHIDSTSISIGFTVALTDLTPVSMGFPLIGVPDSNITISWTVGNIGTGPALGHGDRVYISYDNQIGNDSVIVSNYYGDTLFHDSTYTTETTISLPSTEGYYWFVVETDYNNRVFEEGGESNNLLISSDSIWSRIPPRPDLRVTSIDVPQDGWTGQFIDVSWTVMNYGDSSAGGAWTDKIYIALDSAFQNLQNWMTFEYSEGLGIGESYTHIHPIQIPEDKPGEYWVKVVADFSQTVDEYEAENNNVRIADSTVIIYQTPFPDLQVDSISMPDSASSGQSIAVEWLVRNHGSGPTDAPVWYDCVYLSGDTVLGDDIFAGCFANPYYLNSGQSYLRTGEFEIPWNFGGMYYIRVVTDASHHVNEHYLESNNYTFSNERIFIEYQTEPAPDLAAELNQSPSNAWAGAPIIIEWTVSNVSEIPAESGSQQYDWVMLSTDSVADASDLLLGSFAGQNLLPDSSYFRSRTITLSDTLGGDYYLFVWADALNKYD
ncbi:MAG: CARDB domain-containing protein, partial [Candidatus Zixiibacteriota bacterium]